MLSPFIVNQQAVTLHRFPAAQVNRSLQAWDAADEFIVQHVHQHNLLDNVKKVAIFNDSFGALAINFSDINVLSVSDSYVATKGLIENFAENFIPTENISQQDCLAELPTDIDLVLFKIPKSKALLVHQLIALQNALPAHAVIIAGARAKDIHSNTLKLFEKYLGQTRTSLAVKKARLVFSEVDKSKQHQAPAPLTWPLENTDFTISNHANVFAREQLDLGARVLLAHLPKISADTQVVDLGCGNGVIGLSMLAKQPHAKVSFVDESYMAVTSCRENIANNLPDQLENCRFMVNDCLTDMADNSQDLVLCNPPFHQQQATTDHIAWQMFKDSFRVLKPGGELRIIGNRQLGYHVKLKRLFGNERLVASNKKFVVISAIKR